MVTSGCMTVYFDPVDKREGSSCLSQEPACMNLGCHCNPTGKMISNEGEADGGQPHTQRSILTGK